MFLFYIEIKIGQFTIVGAWSFLWTKTQHQIFIINWVMTHLPHSAKDNVPEQSLSLVLFIMLVSLKNIERRHKDRLRLGQRHRRPCRCPRTMPCQKRRLRHCWFLLSLQHCFTEAYSQTLVSLSHSKSTSHYPQHDPYPLSDQTP